MYCSLSSLFPYPLLPPLLHSHPFSPILINPLFPPLFISFYYDLHLFLSLFRRKDYCYRWRSHHQATKVTTFIAIFHLSWVGANASYLSDLLLSLLLIELIQIPFISIIVLSVQWLPSILPLFLSLSSLPSFNCSLAIPFSFPTSLWLCLSLSLLYCPSLSPSFLSVPNSISLRTFLCVSFPFHIGTWKMPSLLAAVET